MSLRQTNKGEEKREKKREKIERKTREEERKAREKAEAAMKRLEKEKKKQKEGGRGKEEGQHRMTSITRKIHWYWIRKKIFRLLFFNVILLLCCTLVYLLAQEKALVGGFSTKNSHILHELVEGDWKSLVYQVESPEGKMLLEVAIYPIFQICTVIFFVLLGFQFVGFVFAYGEEERVMRGVLGPLNELALKADRLSRLSFSEDKYQVIEDAISHIQPGENDADSLSFGDSDLVGIEAAMNNLLKRMRETYRQQARFVNDASHELRTPIAVIQGYVNLLDRWGKTDEKILEESIQAIKHESEHMNHLVEQLLFLARGDSGRTVLKMQDVSTGQLMQEIYEESLLIDEGHRYRLKEGESVTLQADMALLKQAVRILVDNGAKYTPKGGGITLGYGRLPTGEAFLQVQDEGLGMKEEDVVHIFERFYRSDEVRSYGGTGLGLSIAKWIVDRHHGKFEILSRTELGTRIRIVIPCGS